MQKKNKKRPTVGKMSLELARKVPETTDPIELEREIHKTYEKEIETCVERCKSMFIGNFYVIVETKKERLMHNVLRNYIFGRTSCPTPTYDQTVYKYYRKPARLDFLWVVPAKDVCEMFKQSAIYIVPEEQGLLKYVLDFYDGTLLTLAKRLNGERKDSNIIEKL
jgi:hypothetical protein